ncbi:unnamed protein product [Cochlearia groenlandica]
MDSEYFHGDSRRRASYLFTNGFPPQASLSSGFGFSSRDRTSPMSSLVSDPFLNQLSRMNLTTASMSDSDLGLCRDLSRMCVSDEERTVFTGTHPFLRRREEYLHGWSRFELSSLRDGYIGDGDSHSHGLRSFQDYYNPNPRNRVFTEHMSCLNRGLLFESQSLSEQDLPLNLASMVGIYGSVYLMAKDPLGCRFLQQLVEEGSYVDLAVIFRGVIGHVTELGMDPFGNYLIQKIIEICNEEQRTQILIVLSSKLVKVSLNTYGTRVVQKLIETVSTKEQISLLVKTALKPGFISLVTDSNGNHVIVSCLKHLAPNDNKFVLEAATRFCTEIATHRHGCCVLQRCVLHSAGAERGRLVAEISRNSLLLAQDPYGNYVVQYLIEQKIEGVVNVIFELRGNYAKLSTQKFSSHVVEQCLRHYPESRSHIVRELVSVPNFEQLLQDPYANYVIQSALSLTKGYIRSSLVEKVRRCGNLRTNPYCKKIFSRNRSLKI